MSASFPFSAPEPEPEPIDPCARLAEGIVAHHVTGEETTFILDRDKGVRATQLDVLREVWCEDVYHMDHVDFDGRAVIDVGAHIGAFSLRALRQGARVYAFEASIANITRMNRNLTANGFTYADVEADRIDSWNYAVADYDGTILFADDGVGMGATRDGYGREPRENETKVRCLTLNQAIDRAGIDIALLKVDIEGGEYAAFEVVLPEMLRRVERIAIETHPSPGGEVGQLIETLLHTHHVEAFGRPDVGGMIHARRY